MRVLRPLNARCFCKLAAGPDCPTCSRPDYSKMQASNGDADRHALVAATNHLRAVVTED